MFVLHYMKFSHEVLAQQISYIAIPSIVAETFFFSSLPLFYNMHPAQCVLIEVDINDEFNRLQVVPS